MRVLALQCTLLFCGEDCVAMHFAQGYLVWVIGWRLGVDFGLCLIESLSAVTAAYVCVLDPCFFVVFARLFGFLILFLGT